MHIRRGERLEIVGRTGARKSSIMTVLFSIVESSAGSITIDSINITSIDITSIGLHDFRSRMSIVPQVTALLRGTVSLNLDPFN